MVTLVTRMVTLINIDTNVTIRLYLMSKSKLQYRSLKVAGGLITTMDRRQN